MICCFKLWQTWSGMVFGSLWIKQMDQHFWSSFDLVWIGSVRSEFRIAQVDQWCMILNSNLPLHTQRFVCLIHKFHVRCHLKEHTKLSSNPDNQPSFPSLLTTPFSCTYQFHSQFYSTVPLCWLKIPVLFCCQAYRCSAQSPDLSLIFIHLFCLTSLIIDNFLMIFHWLLTSPVHNLRISKLMFL